MAQNRVSRRASAAVAAALLLAGPGYGADDAPPPLPAQAPAANPPASAPETAAGGPAAASEPQQAQDRPKPYAQIEQKHVGRRVSELIVTPAGFTYHYTMMHLDDQDPGTTPLQPHPELSVPRLFRVDF